MAEIVRPIKMPGRKPWQPTDEERTLVEHCVAIGYTQEQIAALMGKSILTLARRCPSELALGALKVNAKIGGALFQKAMGGDTAALIFWCKTRLGWRETANLDVSVSPADLLRLIGEKLAA